MRPITEEEAVKLSLLNLVKHHRKACASSCGVCLADIYKLAQWAGLEFTDEERELFF